MRVCTTSALFSMSLLNLSSAESKCLPFRADVVGSEMLIIGRCVVGRGLPSGVGVGDAVPVVWIDDVLGVPGVATLFSLSVLSLSLSPSSSAVSTR